MASGVARGVRKGNNGTGGEGAENQASPRAAREILISITFATEEKKGDEIPPWTE